MKGSEVFRDGYKVLPKRLLIFNGLHGVITRNIEHYDNETLGSIKDEGLLDKMRDY
jgi:hypothetical protein